MEKRKLTVLPGSYAVCKLPLPGESESQAVGLPNWKSGFFSYTRTDDEISLVVEEKKLSHTDLTLDRKDAIMNRGWKAFKVEGVLASILRPLREGEISIFAVSTYDTDYLFVQERDLPKAVNTLQFAGFDIEGCKQYEISGKRLRLRFFRAEDIPVISSWINSEEELVTWAGPGLDYPLQHEQLKNVFTRPGSLAFTAYGDVETSPIGLGQIGRIDYSAGSARLARLIVGSPSSRGKGYGKELVGLLLRVCFEELKLHRVELGVFDFNIDAIRCYEKCGFIREGTARDYRKVGNTYWNLITMSILDHEYFGRGGT